MKKSSLFLLGTIFTTIISFTGTVHADGDSLAPQDAFVTTIYDKAIITGEIARGTDGRIAFDPTGKLMFNYSGAIHAIGTDKTTGVLNELEGKIGSIVGQAAFPMDFAMLAIGMRAYMDGVGPMPAIPPVIEWTCNSCTMVVGENTYKSIVDVAEPGASTEAQRFKGRAFTGIGPAEVGQISPYSMSVRMAGCSVVVGVDGPNKGKVGSLCMNATATFDLAGVNLADPFASIIKATGTSNCVTVLHEPIM